MYILSGTLYIIFGILTLLAYFIWYYFMWYYYTPLLIVGGLFLILGILSYYLEFKRKDNK